MKIWLSFSGGKDSVLTLDALKSQGFSVEGALVTISLPYRRITMHGIQEELILKQTQALGLKCHFHYIPEGASNEEYVQSYRDAVQQLVAEEGLTHLAFGDIFLEDLRRFREQMLSDLPISLLFPLWMQDTRQLAESFISKGFRAYVVAVMEPPLEKGFVGKPFNKEFLSQLPEGVDPCGEWGEFHSFVYDGYLFKEPVKIRLTDRVKTVEYPTSKVHMAEVLPSA
ncbi:MAG: ATP-binding protein [Chlorobi bacterium]|nr:ATP-binding protein [Chlorobiota bacterium]